MADIKVDWSELLSKSESMKNESVKMEMTLEEIRRIINDLNESYQSNASEQMIHYMNTSMKKAFERYKQVVDEYAKFLLEAGNMWGEVENVITEKANMMLDFK